MKSTPNSSRKRRRRGSSREDVVIGPPSPEAQPLGDEVSGTGSQTASTQEVVDPAGVNGFVASQIVFPRPTFVIDNLEYFLMSDRHIADRDRWSLQLLGKCFRYKDMELEDDPEFRLGHPSNCFKIHLLVHYDGSRMEFINATVRYARMRLFFICVSIDRINDYELIPVDSFHPNLSYRRRFYHLIDDDGHQASGNSAISVPYTVPAADMDFGNFIQGVDDLLVIIL